jgi:hypothetical protein
MSSFSSLEAKDIVWELVRKTFSAWATAQQNFIVYKKGPTPDILTCPIGKGFQMPCRASCRCIQRKNGLG